MLEIEWTLLLTEVVILEGDMPKTREAFKVQARLGTKDERRLKKLVEMENVSIADFVRTALLEYMKRKETEELDETERE